jgi:O-antigen ligase
MSREYRCTTLPLRLHRSPAQIAVPALLAATLLAMVLGSSWTSKVQTRASGPRWAVLLALCFACLWVVRGHARRLVQVVLPLLPLLALMVLSATWSADERLTLGRAFTMAIVFGTASALAVALETGLIEPEWIAGALVIAMVVGALAGLVLLGISQTEAVRPGTGRLNGIGGDPNTMSSLFALGLPFAVVMALGGPARARWFARGAVLLLVGSIVASGSRGSLLAAAFGCAAAVALVSRSRRSRLRGLGIVALATVAAGAAMIHPIGSTVSYAPAPTGEIGQAHTGPGGRYTNAELVWRLQDDIGSALPGKTAADSKRTFLGTSGRAEAWVGALEDAAERPLVGYGFGTEPIVFVDRYIAFQGSYVENSYIGLVLQLGAAGLLLFVLFVVLAGRRLVRGLRGAASAEQRRLPAGFAGAAAAGLVLAITQSFAYSAGNVATLTFWIATLAAAASLHAGGREVLRTER